MITNTTLLLTLLAGGLIGAPLYLITALVAGDSNIAERVLAVFCGIWVFVIDGYIRAEQDGSFMKRYLHPSMGGHMFFIPAWIAVPALMALFFMGRPDSNQLVFRVACPPKIAGFDQCLAPQTPN